MNYELMAQYIIDKARNESESGHQIIIFESEIEKEFGIQVDETVKYLIERELYNWEEVADVILHGGAFDVLLYLAYEGK